MGQSAASRTRPWAWWVLAVAAAGCDALPTYTVDPSLSEMKAERVCEHGSHRCLGELLFTCGADRTEWEFVRDCAEPGRCDSVTGSCIECGRDDHRCDGARLEACRGTAWELAKECSSSDECNLATASCTPCTAGARQCSGKEQTELQQCDDAHVWQTLDRCVTRELCKRSISDAPVAGGCQPAGCPEAGRYRCDDDGTRLSLCPVSQLAWSEVDACASAALCERSARDAKATDARGRQCLPPECAAAGARRCQGNSVERCNDELTTWLPVEVCEAPLACNPAVGACGTPCEPGDRTCNDAELQECDDERTWVTLETCANHALCSLTDLDAGARQCAAPSCPLAAEYRCNDKVLEQCNAEQTAWEQRADCGSSSLCNQRDGRCEAPACQPQQLRCSPDDPRQLEECNDQRSGWSLLENCAKDESCNLSRDEPCVRR